MASSAGRMDSSSIIKSYTVNLIAPSVLSNSFMNQFENQVAEKVILNISSGAGKNPVDGWSVYCATKSGIDMFSKTLEMEQNLKPKTIPLKLF